MKELQSFSIVAPGFYGLNTQDSGISVETSYATVANNLVIDKFGRLGARKGWVNKTTDSIYNGQPVRFLAEHVDAANDVTVLSGGNHLIGKGGIAGPVTDITPAGYTINDNEWTASNLYGLSLLCQLDHEPLVYDELDVTEPLLPMTAYLAKKSNTDTQNYGVSYPHHSIAAYGRFWAFNDNTVFWSTDIADAKFPSFSGGTSGTLNIAAVLPKNVDTITGLALHNDFLVIFCEHNIVIYAGASNPIQSNFALHDVITGAGCIATGSIQNTGNDLIFLSDTGVRSLGRLVQEKSLPMRELTNNVQDELLQDIADEAETYEGSLRRINSVYSEAEGFYLLSMPGLGYVYCLDMRQPLPDGAARVTKWVEFNAYSLLRRRDRTILIGKDGVIGQYSGYLDNGETYVCSFMSSYNTMQAPTVLKLLKKVKTAVIGGSGQEFVINTILDFGEKVEAYPLTIAASNTVYEFNLAEYTVAEFSGNPNDVQTDVTSIAGSGSTIQIGFDAKINNQPLSVQKLDLWFKTGRNL